MKVNGSTLAEVFSISRVTVDNWLNDGMPREEDNGTAGSVYDTRECINWYTEREKAKLITADDGKTYDPIAEKGRLTHHQANNEALKEAQLRGDLIASADVVKQWSDAILAFRNKMLAIPSKLAKTAINAETVKDIERDADSLVAEALKELAIYERNRTSTSASTESGKTTAETDGQSVGRQVSKTKRRGKQRAGSMVN